MKTKALLPLLAVAAGLAFNAAALAADHGHAKPAVPAATAAGRLDEPTAKDAAWLAQARKEYPLKTCVISGEDLGSMGDATEWIYRRDGQPDRLVRFCCDGCLKGFKKDPAAALKRIDDAGKAGTKPAGHAH